jgi:hypothetical protein
MVADPTLWGNEKKSIGVAGIAGDCWASSRECCREEETEVQKSGEG